MNPTTPPAAPALTVGSRACQCAVCAALFNSLTAFERHRTGPIEQRRCLTPREMDAQGMSVNDRGFWRTSVYDRRPGVPR